MPESRRSFNIINEAKLVTLSIRLLRSVNQRIEERIITSDEELSPTDNLRVPSAAAVVKLIAQNKFVKMVPVIGNINQLISIDERDSGNIYLQKDDENDSTWSMYIWVEPDEDNGEDGYWIGLGDTSPNLGGYWSKSQGDVAELYNALHLDEKVDRSDIEPYSEEEIFSILNEAFINTTEIYPSKDLEGNVIEIPMEESTLPEPSEDG